jgi:hypothetical protein
VPNTLAPFGFSQFRSTGSVPTYEQVEMKIAAANTTAIFSGDAVVPVTGSVTGYIAQATASTVPLAGIFVGCKYISTSQKRTVWSNYWPGSDATGDVTAYVVNDPGAQFLVQSNTGSAVTAASVGRLCQLSVGTGNTASGLSGMTIGSVGTTATFPFRIVELYANPIGPNGTDATAQYNWLIVAFNNALTRSNGAQTGIS